MKKMILVLAILVSTVSAFASEVNVNEKVQNAFKSEFTNASEVAWFQGDTYFRATFNYKGVYLFAFYNDEGELLALSRYISPTILPFILQNNLKKNYEGYWVSDLFEASKNGDTCYYITIENADTKIVLKSAGNSWNVYSKHKKS